MAAPVAVLCAAWMWGPITSQGSVCSSSLFAEKTYISDSPNSAYTVVFIQLSSAPRWVCRVPALGLPACPKQAQEKPNQALQWYSIAFVSSFQVIKQRELSLSIHSLSGSLWASLRLSGWLGAGWLAAAGSYHTPSMTLHLMTFTATGAKPKSAIRPSQNTGACCSATMMFLATRYSQS